VQWRDQVAMKQLEEPWTLEESIYDIMGDTQCMVKFAEPPLSRQPTFFKPRRGSTLCKTNLFNQIAITGSPHNVEEARVRIRDLSPITITLSVPDSQYRLVSLLDKWRAEKQLADYSRVHIEAVEPDKRGGQAPFFVLRAARQDSGLLEEAAEKVVELLVDNQVQPFGWNHDFGARLEVPLAQRSWLTGDPDGILYRAISSYSRCLVTFPLSEKQSSATYFFTGSAKAVVKAVRMFYDVMPVRLIFEAEERDLLLKSRDGSKDSELGVRISVSVHEGEGKRHTVMLTTMEENAPSLYKSRDNLLLVTGRSRKSKNAPEEQMKFLKFMR